MNKSHNIPLIIIMIKIKYLHIKLIMQRHFPINTDKYVSNTLGLYFRALHHAFNVTTNYYGIQQLSYIFHILINMHELCL